MRLLHSTVPTSTGVARLCILIRMFESWSASIEIDCGSNNNGCEVVISRKGHTRVHDQNIMLAILVQLIHKGLVLIEREALRIIGEAFIPIHVVDVIPHGV